MGSREVSKNSKCHVIEYFTRLTGLVVPATWDNPPDLGSPQFSHISSDTDDIIFLYMLFVLQFLQALADIFDCWFHVLCRDQRQELLVGERCLLPLAELILC